MFFLNSKRIGLRRLALKVALVLVVFRIDAAETDNFSLPLDVEFADFGDFIEALHTRAIETSVGMVNNRIEKALNLKDPAAQRRELERWHSPEALAKVVAGRFGEAPLEKARIEAAIGAGWARQVFPDQTLSHKDITLNVRGRPVMDLRGLLQLVQSKTFKAYGVYFGTDKLVHFHQLGSQYYERYHDLLREGGSPNEARRQVIHHFSEEAVLAEDRGFGTMLSGVYSNADMAANYLGFMFLLNLTEAVMLQGDEQAPLVVRCGVFWRLNDQVRSHSGWFRSYLSDHLNEALNPNLYSPAMRPHVQRILEERADQIVEFYTCRDGRPEDAGYFEQLSHELSTYYGEPYGHSGQFEKLMHLGNTCIPVLKPSEPETLPAGLVRNQSDLSVKSRGSPVR